MNRPARRDKKQQPGGRGLLYRLGERCPKCCVSTKESSTEPGGREKGGQQNVEAGKTITVPSYS